MLANNKVIVRSMNLSKARDAIMTILTRLASYSRLGSDTNFVTPNFKNKSGCIISHVCPGKVTHMS